MMVERYVSCGVRICLFLPPGDRKPLPKRSLRKTSLVVHLEVVMSVDQWAGRKLATAAKCHYLWCKFIVHVHSHNSTKKHVYTTQQ